MWECPNCARLFRNDNQAHSCQRITEQEFLINRKADLILLYNLIKQKIESWGEYHIDFIRGDLAIFKAKTSFLAVRFRKHWLDIEFFLDSYIDHPRIKKYLQTSSKRFAYVVRIDIQEDLDNEMLDWLQFSYKLICKA